MILILLTIDCANSADEYIRNFAIPNFYFHVVTAYALLRSCGVRVGKLDYLGVPEKKEDA